MESPKRLLERLLECCIILAISAYLLRLAARWLEEAVPYLLVAAGIILIAIIGYRTYQCRKDSGKW